LKKVTPRIAITSGEPAGIGPDLCLMLAQQNIDADIIIIGDKDALAARAKQLNIDINLLPYDPKNTQRNQSISVLHLPTTEKVIAGNLNVNNSQYVLNTLNTAIVGCQNNDFDAIVTAPVHKGIINEADIDFTGHTEYLADRTNTQQVVMMLVGGGLRVALATTHLPLSKVAKAITKKSLEKTIRILHADLIGKFNIKNPRILIAGLNPHAGEDGYLGGEEITTINPVLVSLRKEGMELIGALPADTLFTEHHLKNADAVLAMYHDQGLPVLKHASFGKGINITLGLPIIRTSVDHGTALDLAGTGNINIGSMLAAADLAIKLANNKISTK
jgi:4-hydroxythreonine-4-phosphate dehydrogenase|tara:strand:+ start:1284 stop:2276 length:993 start_codon:yes stop_codon:yes gene_type:complete